MSKKLTIAGFRRFLEACGPRARFQCRNANRCPLAVYTGRKTNWFVLYKQKYPKWGQDFVYAFDDGDQKSRGAKQALEILLKVGYRKA